MPTSPVSFEEITTKGSPLKVTRDGSATATRTFKVAGADALDFMAYLLIGDSGFPLGYPGLPGMRVDEVEREPHVDRATGTTSMTDASSEIITHDWCEIKASYKPFPIPHDSDSDDLPSGTWAEYKIKQTGAKRAIPKSHLQWASDGQQVEGEDVEDSVFLIESDHVVTWHNVPQPPWQAIGDCEGCVNSAAWRVPSINTVFAAETLLFLGATTALKLDIDSTNNKRSLEYTFRSRSWRAGQQGSGNRKPTTGSYTGTVYGWQYIIRPDVSGGFTFDKPVRPDGSELYSTADFATLFQFDATP
jgi:hypothetical protein